jgi:hypothetical protein
MVSIGMAKSFIVSLLSRNPDLVADCWDPRRQDQELEQVRTRKKIDLPLLSRRDPLVHVPSTL